MGKVAKIRQILVIPVIPGCKLGKSNHCSRSEMEWVGARKLKIFCWNVATVINPKISWIPVPLLLFHFYPILHLRITNQFVLFVTFIRYAASVQSLTFIKSLKTIKSIKKNHFHVSWLSSMITLIMTPMKFFNNSSSESEKRISSTKLRHNNRQAGLRGPPLSLVLEPKEEGALVVVVLLPVAPICAEQCEVDFHTWFDFGLWQWFLPNVGRILTPWASPDFRGSRSHTKCTRHPSIWKQD